MSEVNANINIGIDSSQALASLRTLQNQISSFNKSIVTSNAQAIAAQKTALSGLTSQIGATKAFSTSIVNVESSVSRLGNAIDKNKLGLGEYFRYGVASSKNFGRVFAKEHTEMTALATERVKRLQTQYIALGAAQNGVTKAMAVRPLALFNADTAIATQRQQLFSKLLNDGSTSLINFGKNTQWAGRQLMVGFTVPLTIFGGMAGKIFMDLERQVVNFRRVYGDAMTPAGEADQMIQEIQNLGKEFTKYGIAVKDTVGLAGDIAATGAQGEELVAATAQSTRLATLGMIEMDQAMTATISLQTAFKLSNEELAESVNFLNAVENQTVLSLDDITVAIPKVAPIIKGLGGDVQDLAYFLTAMREGGVNAAEGANALKSGLASLINPTKGAREQLEKVGIDIDSIISTNKGDIRATVQEFGSALMTLDKFGRQQTLAKVFGKYQFARLGALFENISTEGSQASRVIDLAGQSIEDLAGLADKELGAIEESIGMKFTGALERLKLAIAPVGEIFLKIATPILEIASKILDKFNELSPGIKQFITILVAGVGVVVPTVIMLIGLFGNFIGQAIKGFAMFNNFFNRLRGGGKDLGYMANEQLDAAAAATTLEGRTESLTAALNIQRSAVGQLARAYGTYVAAASTAATGLPQAFRGQPGRGMATGGFVAGTGNKDSEPAMLTPGEFVINADASKKFGPLLTAINEGRVGEYAEGRTLGTRGQRESISFGDLGSVELSVFSQESFRSIQEMADGLPEGVKEVKAEFMEILRGLETTQNVTKGIIQDLEEVKRSQSPEISSMAGGRRASFPGSETPETQLARQTGMSQAEISAELRVAQVSAQGAVDAVDAAKRTYVDVFRELGIDAESISVEANLARAHTQNVDKSQGLAAWHSNFWQMQSQAENQFLETGIKQSQRNQDFLMKFMDETEDAQGLMTSMTSGISLTEREYEKLNGALTKMLAAVRANPMLLTEGKGVSSSFLTQAIGAQGAYAARSTAGLSYGSPRSVEGMAEESLTALRTVNRSASPAETYAREGDYAAQGYAEGITRSANIPIKAANQMAQRVTKATRSASRPQGPAGTSTSEINAQIKAENRAARVLRGPSVREGDLERRMRLSTLRPGEESTRIANIDNARAAAMKEEVSRSHDLAIKENEKLTSQTSEVSKEMSNTKGYAKKFGGALKNGSLKLTGAMFAMDGLVFAASMMDNSLGEFAQKIMPAVFAVQGLAQIMPMLLKALPLLLTPIGLIGAAFASVAVAGFALKKGLDNNIAAGKKMSDSMNLASSEIQGLAGFFNGTVRDISKSKKEDKIAGLTPEAVEEGRKFVETEFGKTMVEQAKLSFEQNASGFATNFANQLSMAIVSGAITPDQAKAVASGISGALEKEGLSAQVVAQITQILSASGEDITNKPMTILANIVASVELDEKTLKRQAEESAKKWGDSFEENFFGAELLLGEFDEVVRNSVAYTQSLISNAKSLSDNIEYQIVAQQDKINKLKEEIRLEKEKEKNAKTEDGRKKASETRILKQGQLEEAIAQRKKLREEQSEAVAQRRAKLLEYMRSLTEEDGQLSDVGRETLTGMQRSVEANTEGLDTDKMLASARVAMETQRREAGLPALDEQKQRELRYQMIFDLSIGEADPEASKILDDLYRKQGGKGEASQVLGITMGLRVEGDFDQANEVERIYANLGEEARSDFLISLKTEGKSPEEVLAFGNFLLKLPEDLPENIKTTLITAAEGMSVEELDNMTSVLKELEALPPSVRKNITVEAIGATALQKISKNYDLFQGKENAKKQARVVFGEEPGAVAAGLKAMSMGLEDFAKSPSSVKIAVAAIMSVELDVPKGMSPDAAQRWIEAERLRLLSAAMGALAPGTDSVTTETEGDTTDDTKDTGGSETKSFIQQLIDDTKANLELFPKMLNKLKGKGIPQQIVEMIGGGEEGLAKAKEILNLSKKKLKELIANYKKSTVAQTLTDVQNATTAKKDSKEAQSILEKRGFSKEDAKELASNTEYVFAILNAKTGKGKNSVNQVIAALREFMTVTKEAKNPVDELNAAWSDYSNAVEMAFDVERTRVENEFAEKRYGAEQKTTKEIQKQIDANEDLIQIQQDLIDKKQEEINDYERINDLTSQNVNDLQRQDELRNRVSDALSHELDLMSQQEASISKAYDERVNALNKVQELNNTILQQQKDQLNISQSLSEGDIYAATAAAQEMRQNQIKNAQDQARSGLEQGKQNAIDSLRTGEGLTREEAEKQIANTKEQSYQASLMIRIEEDKIYANSLEVRRLTNEIYNINEDMIEPLTNQNNQHSRILENHQKALDFALSNLTAAGLTANEFQRQKDEQVALVASIAGNVTKVNEYRDAWIAAGNAAREALAKASAGPTDAGGNPSLGNIRYGTGQVHYAGGMIKGYTAGGVAGDGSRDSIPAMLTPGEYVIRKAMVDKYGTPMFEKINQGSFSMPSFNTGEQNPTNVSGNSGGNTNVVAPMYNNYSVNVSVSNSGASADEIANKTLMKIKQLQSTQIRSGRGF